MSMTRYVDSLKNSMKFKIKQYPSNQCFKTIIFADSSEQDYTLHIQELSDNDQVRSEDQAKAVRERGYILNSCDHPNILKLIDELAFEDKYIFKMERCQRSLKRWMVQNHYYNSMNPLLFIDIALQILDAVEYLHSKDYYLTDFCNENILLDSHMNIKIYNFGPDRNVNTQKAINQFLLENTEERYFYISPEMLKFANLHGSTQFQKTKEADIWSVGISLYLVAGGKMDNVIQLTKGRIEYIYTKKVNSQINMILESILKLNPKERPSIQQLKIKLRETIQSSIKLDIFKNIEDTQREIQTFTKGVVLYEKKLYQESQDTFKQLVEVYPKNDMYLAWLARTYAQFNELEKTKELAKQSLEINDNNYVAYNVLGYIYSETQQYENAIKNLSKSIEIQPDYEVATKNLGLIYRFEFQKPEAEEVLKSFTERNPQDFGSFNNLGLFYKNVGKYEQSKNCFLHCLKSSPSFYYSWYNLGVLFLHLELYQKSVYCFNKSIKCSPYEEIDEILNRIGNNLFKQQQFEKSIKYYKRANKIDPEEDAYIHNINLMKANI